jgi:hypothetical protein
MSFGFTDIDHLMIRVGDLDRAVGTFESLGFYVAPPRTPFETGPMDSAGGGNGGGKKAPVQNRLVILQPYPGREDVANFFELMHFEHVGSPPHITKLLCFLLDTEGPKTIVCHTHDIGQTVEKMQREGIDITLLPSNFEVGWEHDGEWIPARGRPAVPVFGQMPFPVNPYETIDIDSFRYKPFSEHPNTAEYMAGITGISEDIKAHAAFMADKVFGTEVEWKSDDVALIRPRDLYLRIVSPRGFAELYPDLDYSRERVLPALCGVTVAVESIDAVRDILTANGVEHHDTANRTIAVPRHQANNTIIEFVPAAS